MPGEAISKVEGLSDRLNPLLVREVRQSLRGRIFTSAIILTSVLSLVVIICGVLWTSSSDFSDVKAAGRPIFYFIYFFMWGLLCVVFPVMAAERFRSERSSGEYELFLITGIPAKSIILGKLQSSLVQAFLILSVAAPFMMVCYLMRGISALDILTYIVLIFSFIIALTQAGILLGSITSSRAFFNAIAIPFVIGLLFSFYVSAAVVERESLFRFSGTAISPYLAFTILLVFLVYVFCIMNLASVALLDLPTKNRPIYLKIFLLLAAVFLPCGILPLSSLDRESALVVFYMFFAAPAMVCALFVPLPHGIEDRTKPSNGWRFFRFVRMFKFLFHPGRGSTVMWYSAYVLVLAGWEFLINEAALPVRFVSFIPITCAALLFWSLAGNSLRRFMPAAPTFLLSGIGCGAASLAGVFLAFTKQNELGLLLCPATVAAFMDKEQISESALFAALGFWIIVFAYGASCHIRQMKTAKPQLNSNIENET